MTARRDSLGRVIGNRYHDVFNKWCRHEADHSWMARAACHGHDPELWSITPGYGGTGRHPKPNPAGVVICRGCPVRLQCLRYALATGMEDGLWGGLDPTERKRLRKASVMNG